MCNILSYIEKEGKTLPLYVIINISSNILSNKPGPVWSLWGTEPLADKYICLRMFFKILRFRHLKSVTNLSLFLNPSEKGKTLS